ncbi:SDR family oxidoreductase [Streptomyces sp. NPDC091217]|uniref:SDR family oxidoreductase n=1 Tax=Streptomyces sp. NPDC091217 TaxID=3365975 RepID=UPI003820F9F3
MILITGAGGKTGRHVIRALRERGVPVRALARGERIHELAEDGVETLAGDMLDASVLARAFEGVTGVVHIGPTAHQHEVAMGVAVADAASAAGVERFMLFSVHHPQLEHLVNHQNKARAEDYVVTARLPYTILQPMHYLQNIDPVDVVREGAVRLPYSMTTPLAFVDLVDVAEVCAKVLTEDGHRYATYPLCGSDYLGGEEIAAIIAEVVGRPIAAESVPLPVVLEFLGHGQTMGPYQRAFFSRLFSYYDDFGITGNPNVLRFLLGREPSTMSDYVRRSLAAGNPNDS